MLMLLQSNFECVVRCDVSCFVATTELGEGRACDKQSPYERVCNESYVCVTGACPDNPSLSYCANRVIFIVATNTGMLMSAHPQLP